MIRRISYRVSRLKPEARKAVIDIIEKMRALPGGKD
jgi:hypothetical protein